MLVPSGSTSRFHGLMSASVMFLPRPGVSASAAPAPNVVASARERRKLRVDMFDLPFVVDGPAGDAVVVLIGESQRIGHRPFGLAAGRNESGAGRLHIAGLVPGAALQDHRLSIPPPWHAEAGE